ncbi:MAG: AraC family transcriptional regulator [bacterium]|nr:AraC family transcriptional regulator [bacterium]
MAGETGFRSGQFETDDPALFEEMIRPWDLIVDVVGNANPHFKIDFLSMQGLTIYRDRYCGGIRLQGMPPPGTLVLSVPYGSAGSSQFWSNTIDEPQLYAMHATPLDAYLTNRHSNLVIFIDLEEVNHLEASYPRMSLAVEKLLDRSRHERIARSPLDIHNLSRVARQLLQRAAVANGNELDVLREEFEACLAETVLQESTSSLVGRTDKQAAAVSAALDYLRASGGACESVSNLCRQADVKERTLERGVRAAFDCTVVSFLRRWRLHAARRHLASASPSENSVTEIAYDQGFYDLGRFSTRYCEEFGEYPSVTLKKPARSTPPFPGQGGFNVR